MSCKQTATSPFIQLSENNAEAFHVRDCVILKR